MYVYLYEMVGGGGRPSDIGKLKSSSSLHEVGGDDRKKKSLKDAERNRKWATSDIGRQRGGGRYNLLNLLVQYEFIELSRSNGPGQTIRLLYRVQRESRRAHSPPYVKRKC